MTKHRYIIQAALIATLLLMNSANTMQASEAIWPQFRGPNCSGVAGEGQNPPVKFGPEQNVIWKTPIPSGHSSPCIWGDNIFLTGYTKEKKQLQVFCIERSSGKLQWSQVVPAEQIEKVHSVSSPASSTPCTDGERVYVYFGSFGLICYDFSGKQQWTVLLPVTKTTDGHSPSPIVSGELVILSRDEPNDPYLLAVDRKSGDTVWKQSRRYAMTSHSTPIVWREQLVIHRMGQVVAHAPKDGAPVWSVSIATRGTSTPVVGNDVLFVGAWTNFGEPDLIIKLPDFQTLTKQHDQNGDMKISEAEFPDDLAVAHRPEIGENIEGAEFYIKRFFRGLDSSKDGLIDETEWKKVLDAAGSMVMEHGLAAIKPGGQDDVTATHVLWREKTNVPEVPSPLYYDGRVYMIKNGGIVSCMDAGTGKLLYRERLGAAGLYCSSPICAQGRIYIASSKGTVTVFAAGDTLQVLARNELEEPIFATPAVVENKLYVRTDKHVYAFGE